jgi:hypothetical protein
MHGYSLQGIALALVASSDILPVEDPKRRGHDSCSRQLEKYGLVAGRLRRFSRVMKPQLVHYLQHRKSLSVFLSFVSSQWSCLNAERSVNLVRQNGGGQAISRPVAKEAAGIL